MTADPDLAVVLAARLDTLSLARLGRSLAVFPVAAGDCGACMLEWAALRGAAYGLVQHGITVTDHPAAADILLVTGAMTRVLVRPVQLVLAAMARPCWVVAVGDCAIDGGPFAGAGPVAGGVAAAVAVDLAIPGCPPAPTAMLSGLLTLLEANR